MSRVDPVASTRPEQWWHHWTANMEVDRFVGSQPQALPFCYFWPWSPTCWSQTTHPGRVFLALQFGLQNFLPVLALHSGGVPDCTMTDFQSIWLGEIIRHLCYPVTSTPFSPEIPDLQRGAPPNFISSLSVVFQPSVTHSPQSSIVCSSLYQTFPAQIVVFSISFNFNILYEICKKFCIYYTFYFK